MYTAITEIASFLLNFILHPSLFGVIVIGLIIIFLWNKIKTIIKDIVGLIKLSINSLNKTYNNRLNLMVGKWGNEGDVTAKDKSYIILDISNICYSGELFGTRHTDDGSFYGMTTI